VDGATARPVVGLFGAFDTGDLGEVALRRVLEEELRRRRPDIDLVALAPLGAERPIPGDEGRPARPLPPGASIDSLGLDALIITGDVLGDEQHWKARYPTAPEVVADRAVVTLVLTGTRSGQNAAPVVTWFAVGAVGGEVDLNALHGRSVWARDPATEQQLGSAAVQSGDPLLLAGRVFAPDALRRRLDLLRMCGAVPAGRRVVIETASGLAASPTSEHLLAAVTSELHRDPKLAVVIATLNPTGQPLDSMVRVAGLIAERVHRLPAWVGLDDIAAAMSGSVAVIATSPAGAHLATSLGVPAGAVETGLGDHFDPAIPMLSLDGPDALKALVAGGHPAATEKTIATLDGALAELADRLPRTAAADRTDPEAEEASALAVLQQRLVDERTALQAELSRVQAELDHLRASPEHRLAEPIREGYRRWQRRRT
jgi:ethanolamine utilization microcompartment shell protein EutS